MELGKSRFYELYSSFLRAQAHSPAEAWQPGLSGGDHQPKWPQGVGELLQKRLSSKPPASYSFAAQEVHRLFNFRLDRATVRRFALAQGLAAQPLEKIKAPVRRWQRSRIGELWQMDATPHAFVPGSVRKWHLIDIIDDCSRMVTGARLYAQEVLPSYYDILPRAFLQ